MNKYRKLLLYAVVTFIILFTINISQIFDNLNKHEKNNFMARQSELSIIIHDMNKISDSIFDNIINTKEVIDIFKKAHRSSEEEKNIARDNLYNLLKERYETFTKYGIQQLHFHLPNNDSFLRFHKPSKYGDNLSNIRASVAYVNIYHKAVVGFEEGKIFNGYRFVYPMFDENKKHIGSVEVSSSLLTFKQIFEDTKDLHVDYILKRDVVKRKVFKDQLKNYTNYKLSENFLIQTTLSEVNKKDIHTDKRDIIFDELSKDKNMLKRVENLDKFYYIKIHDFKAYVVNFIPLLNDFTKDKVGYMVTFSESEFFNYFFDTYLITIIFILILSILVGYIFYKKDEHRELIERKALEYKAILDMYKNMVIVINKNNIVNSNNKFLDFFDIKSIEDLGYKCDIKHTFTKKNGFFCPNSNNFIEEFRSVNDQKREVVLTNNNGVEKIFHLYINNIAQNVDDTYIVELIDITEHKKEKEELEEKALIDQLTNIYNRHYFEDIIGEKFQLAKKTGNPLSIIMFDIDHFKIINDKYGHNIGDDSLRLISELYKNSIREEDIFCRWGGEEFIILTNNTLDKAVRMAENLRLSIDIETKNNEKIPHFTCSFGVISLNSVNDFKAGLEKVDKLLYKSKKSGRNMVSY